jgi:hypothetical protein
VLLLQDKDKRHLSSAKLVAANKSLKTFNRPLLLKIHDRQTLTNWITRKILLALLLRKIQIHRPRKRGFNL